jgi:hypothetical protein
MKLHFEPMLLRLGLDLCVPIETKAIAKHAVHLIGADSLLVCLSPSIPQTAVVFEVTPRTVDNYLEQNAQELARNGYEVIKGNRLKALKLAIHGLDVHETDFANINHGPRPGWSCKLAVAEEGTNASW